MRWTPGGVSGDIEDRRGDSGPGFGGFGFGGMRLGIGGTLVLLVLSIIFRTNLFTLFSGAPVQETQRSRQAVESPAEQKEVQFVSFVLDDVQHTWERVLPQQTGTQYEHAKLVLFRDLTNSACGTAVSATGPFYCPGDQRVYIDLGFYDELKERFGAPGEFAEAYVLAHEIGHHVQRLLGTERKVHALQQRNPGAANEYSVALELQADCYAGIWGNSTEQRNIIDQRDVKDGLGAAAAVGDDRLQRMSTGQVNPETFTHGSSQQRMHWFQTGLQSGQVGSCNTFGQM